MLLLAFSTVYSSCIVLSNDTFYSYSYTNVTLCKGVYSNVKFDLTHVNFNCNGSTLIGGDVCFDIHSSGNVIQNCTIIQYETGIYSFTVSNNLYEYNTFFNISGTAMRLLYESNSIIRSNEINNCGEHNLELGNSTNIQIYNNTFSYANANLSDNDGNSAVDIYSSTNVYFFNNSITNVNSTALDLSLINDSLIYNNKISSSMLGIGLEDSNNVTIYGNNLTDNHGYDEEDKYYAGAGMYINNSNSINVSENTFFNNGVDDGFFCAGIILSKDNDNNTFVKNSIKSNNYSCDISAGMVLYNVSGSFDVLENDFLFNGDGDLLSGGIIALYDHGNATILDNAFINNSDCGINVYDDEFSNAASIVFDNDFSAGCKASQYWRTGVRVISKVSNATLNESYNDGEINDIEGDELEKGSGAYIYYVHFSGVDLITDNPSLVSHGIAGNHTGIDLEFANTDCLSAVPPFGIGTAAEFSDTYVDLSSSEWFCVREKSNPSRNWSIKKISLSTNSSFVFEKKVGVCGANVTIYNKLNSSVFSGLTDHTGRISTYIKEFDIKGSISADVFTNYTPHNITVHYGNYTDFSIYNITKSYYGVTKEIEFYIIFDLIPPVIWSVIISPNPVETSNYFTISANVTDNVGVLSVYAVIQGPLYKLLLLPHYSSSIYNNSYFFNMPGYYNVTVTALDFFSNSAQYKALLEVLPKFTPPNKSYCCNITSIGIAEQPFVLSKSKIKRLMEYDYSCSKNLMGLWTYNFYLDIKYLNGSYVIIDGREVKVGFEPPVDAKKVVVDRKAILDHKFVVVHLEVWS